MERTRADWRLEAIMGTVSLTMADPTLGGMLRPSHMASPVPVALVKKVCRSIVLVYKIQPQPIPGAMGDCNIVDDKGQSHLRPGSSSQSSYLAQPGISNGHRCQRQGSKAKATRFPKMLRRAVVEVCPYTMAELPEQPEWLTPRLRATSFGILTSGARHHSPPDLPGSSKGHQGFMLQPMSERVSRKD